MSDPLDVLSLEKAKEHINKTGPNVQPGGDDELADIIGAAVERVERHLGGRELVPPVTFSELMAVKTVFAELWETQQPAQPTRPVYAGAQGPMADDGPSASVSMEIRLTQLLGPPVAPAGQQPQGSFPSASAWPDPVRPAGPVPCGWPR